MKLLIDADVISYRAAFATEKTKYVVEVSDGFTPGGWHYFDDSKTAKEFGSPGVTRLWSRKELEPEDKALMLADVMIADIRDHYATENPTLSLMVSGVGNYRHGIATRASYKGNRAGAVPPTHLRAIRNHMVSKWGASLSQGEEADDMLGIAMTQFPGSVLCSIDKDLLQLAGRHYNFVTKEEMTVSPKEAVLNFYSQVLSGDSTDNIPGLSGIGPVKARKALEGCKSPLDCWKVALAMYSQEFGHDLGAMYAEECAQLVYVRRKAGEIWSAPIAKATQTEELKETKVGRKGRVQERI